MFQRCVETTLDFLIPGFVFPGFFLCCRLARSAPPHPGEVHCTRQGHHHPLVAPSTMAPGRIPVENVHMGVSKNRGGPPKSSIFIGFSNINHPCWGTPIFGNTHIIKNKWITTIRSPCNFSLFQLFRNSRHVNI